MCRPNDTPQTNRESARVRLLRQPVLAALDHQARFAFAVAALARLRERGGPAGAGAAAGAGAVALPAETVAAVKWVLEFSAAGPAVSFDRTAWAPRFLKSECGA
eukprot:SAG22_NODE_317_length_12513_cov_41.467214_9_plen_104_part_00